MNDEFYKQYAEYLAEPDVRKVHDYVIGILGFSKDFDFVLDLGCGLREFQDSALPYYYRGVDLHSPEADIIVDYKSEKLFEKIEDFKPTVIVSLFSIELSDFNPVVWKFYNYLFEKIPSVRKALVSGIYYRDRHDHSYVVENDGSTVFQTISKLGEHEKREDIIKEALRLTIPCPSKMFGPNPIEVWRLLERK